MSSTSIREALAAGDLAWPAEALGRRFVLDGEVVTGHGRGKGLGFPTANLRTWPRLLLPGQGIYAGVAELRRAPLPDGPRRRARTPRSGSSRCTWRRSCWTSRATTCPGEPLAIEFWARLRDEVRYDSVEELVAAIAVDVERTRALVPGDALA